MGIFSLWKRQRGQKAKKAENRKKPQKKRPISVRVQALLFFEFYNIIHFAIQGITKGVQGPGADRFALFHAVQGIGGKALFVYQMIFGNSLLKQRLIRRLIAYHFSHRIHIIILNLLIMLKILSIIYKSNRGKKDVVRR